MLPLLVLLLPASPLVAQPPLQIEVASTFPNSLPMLGDGLRRVIEQVARASAGQIVLRLHEPGALVPAAESVEAVSDGRIAAAWGGAGWLADKDSAFNMFSTVPFGPAMGEYLAWLYHGGGLELARELFAQRNIYNIPCIIIPPEASGWFRREIRDITDLAGLRMRFFGLGAQVMQRFGVITQQTPPGDIGAAMQRGDLDAAEFSLPSMDLPLGLDRYARYYYFPGWHQQATLFDLYINLAQWNALTEPQRAIIELACGDTMRDVIASSEAAQWQALQTLQARGVQLRRWPPEILVAFEDAWLAVAATESARNPAFARVYASYEAFRANYALWRRMNFLQ